MNVVRLSLLVIVEVAVVVWRTLLTVSSVIVVSWADLSSETRSRSISFSRSCLPLRLIAAVAFKFWFCTCNIIPGL